MFARAYDECRRAATYLRWHEGDAEDYAPSIYVRRRRRGSSEGAAPTMPASEVPTAPVPLTSELEPVA